MRLRALRESGGATVFSLLILTALLAIRAEALAVVRPTKTPRPTRTSRVSTPPAGPTDTPPNIDTETPTELLGETPTETPGPADTPTATPAVSPTVVGTATSTPLNNPLAILFREAATFPAGSAPAALTTGDFDGDGNLDLMVVNREGGTVRWLQGKGSGAFNVRSPILIDPAAQPVGVAAADFDGDGLLDVATANSGTGSVSVLFGQGKGKLGTPVTTSVGTKPVALVAQGNRLLVVDAAQNNLIALSVGTDRSVTIDDQIVVGTQPVAIAAGDVNGDGIMDFVVANHNDNSVTVLLGNSNQSLSPQLSIATGRGPSGLALADVNRDGALDLVVAETDDNTVSVWLGSGAGGFRRAGDPIATGISPIAVAIADDVHQLATNDGKPDMFVACAGSNEVMLLNGHGDGRFTVFDRFVVGQDPTALVIGQFTTASNDAAVDAAVCDTQSGTVAVLRSTTPRSYTSAVGFVADAGPTAIAVADFDRDGLTDAVVANAVSNDVSILRGNGRGSLLGAVNFGVGGSPLAVAAGDFNGDGAADVAVATAGSTLLSLLTGDGTGNLRAPVAIDIGEPARRLFATDLNADGLADLTAVPQAGNHLSVLMAGAGFGSQRSVDLDGTAVSVAAGDVDGDGAPDLVVAVTAPAGIDALLGNGDGSFRGSVLSLLPDDPTDVAVADFDEDGHADAAVLSASSATIHILYGTGDGHFLRVADLTAPLQSVAIRTADFNADTHADLAVISSSNDVLAVYAGKGAGEFTAPTSFAVGRQPVGFVVADISELIGGPLPDVLVVNAGSQDVTLLRNSGQAAATPTPVPTDTAGPLTPTPPPPIASPTQTPRPTQTPKHTPGSKASPTDSGGASSCAIRGGERAGSAWLLFALAMYLVRCRRHP